MEELIESGALAGLALSVGLWCYGASIAIGLVRKGQIFTGVMVPTLLAGAGSVPAYYLAVTGKVLFALPVAGTACILLWLYGNRRENV